MIAKKYQIEFEHISELGSAVDLLRSAWKLNQEIKKHLLTINRISFEVILDDFLWIDVNSQNYNSALVEKITSDNSIYEDCLSLVGAKNIVI